MTTRVAILIVAASVLTAALFISLRPRETEAPAPTSATLGERFGYLSQHGNSSCSLSYQDSIPAMADGQRLQGSCCGPMVFDRYQAQVEGLKKYAYIPEIPSDPYDIEAGQAERLMAHYDLELTADEQAAYDYAMANSHEKGPCCCRCWRWYVYGGLGKYLIRAYGFTGQQITEVWNLSDGCGGEEEHA